MDSLINIAPAPIALPGETSLTAIANLFTEIAKDLTPQQKQLLAQRFIEISQPFHVINVAISQNIAAFLAKILRIDIATVKFIAPQPLTLDAVFTVTAAAQPAAPTSA